MPLTILQTWKSRDVSAAPPLYRMCAPTWAQYHVTWPSAWLDDDGIDEYVREHYPVVWASWWQEYPRGIERADLVRYLFLLHQGGLYVDLDFECLRPFDALVAGSAGDVVLGCLSRPDHPEGIPNALMIARRPRQVFWLLVLDEARRARGATDTVERTGPVILGRALRVYRERRYPEDWAALASRLGITPAAFDDGGVDILPQKAVYPICWLGQQWKRKLFLRLRPRLSHEHVRRLFPRSYAITYWVHGW